MKHGRLLIRLAILLICCWIVSRVVNGSDSGSAMIGKPANDFSLQSVDHQQLKLTALKGNVVVLDFWATWCPPCRASLPNLNRLSNDPKLAARGLKVIAINAHEPSQDVEPFLQSNHYSLPVAMDPDAAAERAYDVTAYPTTLVIGRDGLVKYATVGFDPDTSETELNNAIEKALGQSWKEN
jgi:thiol-disulfide isomerase/thioredoxin